MPTSLQQLSPRWVRRLKLLAAVGLAALAVAVIWKLLAVLLPFLLSAVVAYLLLPAVNLMERRTPWGRRWPRATRMATAGLLVAAVLLSVLIVLALGVLRIIDQSTALVERAPDLVADTQRIWEQALAAYENRVPANVREMIDPRLDDLRQALLEGLNQAIWQLLRILQSGVGLIVSLATVPIIMFYLLYEPAGLGRGVRRLMPRPVRDDLSEIARLAGESIGTYLRVQLLLGAMTGVVIGVGLWAMGVSMAPVLAISRRLWGTGAHRRTDHLAGGRHRRDVGDGPDENASGDRAVPGRAGPAKYAGRPPVAGAGVGFAPAGGNSGAGHIRLVPGLLGRAGGGALHRRRLPGSDLRNTRVGSGGRHRGRRRRPGGRGQRQR